MYPLNGYPNNQITQMLMQNLNQPTPMNEIHTPKVSGKPGAAAFNMPPNSDILLLDETASVIWFVKTDSAGYKTMIPYDISEHKEEKPEEVYKSLEDRIAKLEELVNGKSNTSNAKQRKSESAE